MKRWHTVCSLVAFVLLLSIAAMASRLGGSLPSLQLAGHNPVRLTPQTTQVLQSLQGRVSLTYFASPKRNLPANIKAVEPVMRDLLAAMKAVSPEVIDFKVIDPEIEPKYGADYAARKGIAPVKLQKIRKDASSEQAVWSGLVISHNDYPNAVIPLILDSDLPYIQELLVSNLSMMREPRPTTIAVAAPPQGYNALFGLLSQRVNTRVERIDFDSTATIPPHVDTLFWVSPLQVDQRHVDELERFMASGRSVVVSGAGLSVVCATEGDGKCSVVRPRYSWDRLLRIFGLTGRPELIVDEAIPNQSGMPFPMRLPAALCDIKVLHGFSIGELVSTSVAGIEPDPDLLERAGFESQVVATTSADTRLAVPPAGSFDRSALTANQSSPKQPWIVLVTPRDQWKGSALIIGSMSIFSDVHLSTDSNGNFQLLSAAAQTFTGPERIARVRVKRTLPESIPQLSTPARLIWRAIVIAAVPLLLMIVGCIRLYPGLQGLRVAPWQKQLGVGAVALVVIVCSAGFLERSPILAADLTGSEPRTPSPLVRELVKRLPEKLTAELVISDQRYWPATLKGVERELSATLRGVGIPFRTIRPESLPVADRIALNATGIRAYPIDHIDGDKTVTSIVWSGLRLTSGSRMTAIGRIDPRMLEDIQFLLASACLRLESGMQGPIVGVLSDLPRMSAGQIYSEYTQMGINPPEGVDIYSEAKDLLTRYGYDVRYINPKSPKFPERMHALLWLQPRNANESLPIFSDYLAQGGKAFVALQQYKIRQRQYRGGNYTTVYWPEPQGHRFNEYLNPLGLHQMGEKDGGGPAEILMDRNQGRVALETRVFQRSRFREMSKQEVVRPFLIRTVGSGLSDASPLTARLGALMFIWGNRFKVDPRKLERLGLRSQVLAQTSSRPWKFDWAGGWIPEPALSMPEEGQFMEGPLPLAMAIEGRFPTMQFPETPGAPGQVVDGSRGEKEGALIVTGNSEMFTNTAIFMDGYQHDRFLLNGIASLSYGPQMAALQARAYSPESFPVQSQVTKVTWRIVVVALSPILLLAYGLLVRRRRPELVEG